jgi:hypothetical protein
LPANQEQAMDDFMVDWFGLDIVDDMSGNQRFKVIILKFNEKSTQPK